MFAGLICLVIAAQDEMRVRQFADIRFGMTKKEVVARLGEPHYRPGDYKDSRFWSTTTSIWIGQHGHVWQFGNVTMWFIFDDMGRVTGMMREGPPRWSRQ